MSVTARARLAVQERPWIAALAIGIAVFVVYVLTRNVHNPYTQYVLLSDAFLHGRLYLVNSPPWLEVAQYGTKAFVIDPPAPTLFLMPFVAIFGTQTSEVLVSCAVGASTISMLWIAGRRLWTDTFALAMALLVAFGTVFWWAAADGGYWLFAHVCALFFMAAALVEATGRRRPWLVGILVALAGLCRLSVFGIAPLYAWFVLDENLRITRRNLRRLVAFGSAWALGVAVYLSYNWARFGTIKDLGYYHPRYNNEPWFARGRLSITYIPRHLKAIFYQGPVATHTFPYLRPSFIGLALIFTTPAFLYALRAKLTRRNVVAIVAMLIVAAPLITHGTTGWAQFGYRFSLDFVPPLLLLTASGMRERLGGLKIAVLLLCVLVNLWGVLSFNVFNWVKLQ